MYLSQPAVATYVDRLERRLNVTVFDRSRSGTRVTPSGRDVLPHLEALVAMHEHVERECRRVGRNERSVLSIASHRLGLIVTLPPALRVLSGIVDGLAVSTRHSSDDELIEMVASGDVDLGVGYRRQGATNPDSDLVELPTESTPSVLFVPPDHRLADRASVEPADLAGETMLTLKSPLAYSNQTAYLRDVPDLKWIRTDDTQIVLQMVADGVGVALSIAAAARLASSPVVAIPIPGGAVFELTVMRRAGVEPSPAASILWDILTGVPVEAS